MLLPVPYYTGMSSWSAHIHRGTPSTEPGTDFYVPWGTPVYSPASGVIWGNGQSVAPATGRWVGVNFDNGMSFRSLHNSQLVRTSGRVEEGELIAYSGASGYGSEFFGYDWRSPQFYAETGGDHTHVTLWPTHSHNYGYISWPTPYTIDIMNYVSGSGAGGGSIPFPEEDLTPDQAAQLLEAKNAAVNTETVVRQILGYLEGPEGLVAKVDLIKKGIFDKADGTTNHWDGLDEKAIDTLSLVKQIDAAIKALPAGSNGGGTGSLTAAQVEQIVNEAFAALVLKPQ